MEPSYKTEVTIKRRVDIGMKRIRFVLCLFLIVLSSMSLLCHAQAATPILLQIQVLDASTDHPIPEATVMVFDTASHHYSRWILLHVGRTDPNGYCTIPFEKELQCRVYILSDDPSTPGFDYIPIFRDLTLSGMEELEFRLPRGASITLLGELQFAESELSVEPTSLTVLDPQTLTPLNMNGRVCLFGDSSPHSHLLDLSTEQIIVPAETLVHIRVNTTVSVEYNPEPMSFVMGDHERFFVDTGQNISVSFHPDLSRYNLEKIQEKASIATSLLQDLDDKGFYVNVETHDLANIQSLLDKAEREHAIGFYDECHADLREAYLGISATLLRLEDAIANAGSSITLLMVFLALTAVAISLLLFERWILKGTCACALFAAFLTTLYLIYPGSRLIQTSSFLFRAGLSMMLAIILTFILPPLLGGRVVSIFSLAKQNSRRRKIRFTLTLIPIMILTMSFVTLTSFATGFGLTTTTQYILAPHPDGFMVKSEPASIYPSLYPPLPLSTLDWIQDQPEIAAITPKIESSPVFWIQPATLAPANNASRTIPLTGILGISSSLEMDITHLDDAIIAGRLPYDGEEAVLLSMDATEALDVTLGDDVIVHDGDSSQTLRLVGLFDNGLREVVDIDSKALMPQRMFWQAEYGSFIIESCPLSETVVMDWRIAVTIRDTSLSRIDVQLTDVELASDLARRVALERGLWAWSSINGRVSLTKVEEYIEAKGLSITIPWAMVMLSVVISVINAIFERRDEVAILSSIGLNPTHIEALFIAEAAVLGIIGGGVGYLLGLGSYRVMALLSIAVEVRQKVSALWSLAAMLFAVAAVVVGAVLALRYSVVITPSLLRRWTTGKGRDAVEQLEFPVPVSLTEEEMDSLLTYLKERIQDYAIHAYGVSAASIAMLTKESEEESPQGQIKRIDFKYYGGESIPFELLAEPKDAGLYSLRVILRGGEVYDQVTFIRQAVLEWSVRR